MHAPAAVANRFLELALREEVTLTNMQLQKLPFIAHGWSLALFNRPLIVDEARVWKFGPVYPQLYEALRRYGAGPVTELIHENDDDIFEDDRGPVIRGKFSPHEEKLLKTIWHAFKTYSGLELSALTHMKDAPWSVAKRLLGLNSVIPNAISRNYYKGLLEATANRS